MTHTSESAVMQTIEEHESDANVVELVTDDTIVERLDDGRLYVVIAGESTLVRLGQCFRGRAASVPVAPATTTASWRASPTRGICRESRRAIEMRYRRRVRAEVLRVVAVDEKWKYEPGRSRRSRATACFRRISTIGRARCRGRADRDVAGDLYRLADPASMDQAGRELLWAFVD